jgi:hypothetical protein
LRLTAIITTRAVTIAEKQAAPVCRAAPRAKLAARAESVGR